MKNESTTSVVKNAASEKMERRKIENLRQKARDAFVRVMGDGLATNNVHCRVKRAWGDTEFISTYLTYTYVVMLSNKK